MWRDPFWSDGSAFFLWDVPSRGRFGGGVPLRNGEILDFAFAKVLFRALKSSNFGPKNRIQWARMYFLWGESYILRVSRGVLEVVAPQGCEYFFYCLVRNFNVHLTLFEQKHLQKFMVEAPLPLRLVVCVGGGVKPPKSLLLPGMRLVNEDQAWKLTIFWLKHIKMLRFCMDPKPEISPKPENSYAWRCILSK